MITPKALHPTCARVLTREEARDALGRALRVCRESGYRKLGIHKRIFENREFIHCLYKQHMAFGQSFITFIDVAESSRNFFDSIVDALKETFPEVGQFPKVGDKSGISLPEETGLVIKCLDGLIAVCGTSGEKLAQLQTENRDIAYLLKNNATFSEKLSFVENCLEGHEVFFNDLRHALERVFEKMSPSGELSFPAYTWPGDALTGLQIQFDTGKRTKFFDILMRACHRKGSRSSNR